MNKTRRIENGRCQVFEVRKYCTPRRFLGNRLQKMGGEIVCDNCYTELAKATASEREVKEQAEQAARVALNPSNEKNTVASVLQVYAIINAILGVTFLSL